MTDFLDSGARRALPAWATGVLLALVVVSTAVWLAAATPSTLDGHGSQTYRAPGGHYQPLLGRPLR